jgi:hypothetical protein
MLEGQEQVKTGAIDIQPACPLDILHPYLCSVDLPLPIYDTIRHIRKDLDRFASGPHRPVYPPPHTSLHEPNLEYKLCFDDKE